MSSKRKVDSFNPYLAHDELNLIPGKTTAEQAEQIENGTVNPFTNEMFSNEYKSILAKRRQLPVHKQRAEFLELIHKHQIIILVGETGSGKSIILV
jgi:pre-mRNA-splicing factor ATP-dependent RNA helicase DHX15/PRP43